MSQICPHCGRGFQRLASHEWRCKHKPESRQPAIASSSQYSPSNGQRPSRGPSFPPISGALHAPQFSCPLSQAQTQVKQRCPDCGGMYKDLANHKVCHKRGSGRYADKPMYVEMQQRCPDCGGMYKDLANHKVCHKRGSGRYSDKPMYVEMQVCPDCGKSFKNLKDHKICHGKAYGRHSPQRPVECATPPPHPRASLPTTGWSDYTYSSEYTDYLTPNIGLNTPPPTPPQLLYEYPRGDSDEDHVEEERNAFTDELNGGHDEEEALALALVASLNQEQTTQRGSSSSSPCDDPDRTLQIHLDQCVDVRAVRRIEVDRETIWQSSLSIFKSVRVSDTDRHLMVVFSGRDGDREEAMDAGGPRR